MFRKRFWTAAALILMLASQACIPQQATPSPQAQPGQDTPVPISEKITQPPEQAAQPPAPPNPIQVFVTLEEGQMAHAEVADQGGQLSATSAGGVKFDLSIPAGALPGDYAIRMTPVGKMDGLPLSGGLLGAVQMEPEGLVFLKPATLTITLPAGVPPEEVVPFAYQGSGESLYYYIAKLEGDRLTFQISHFSGFGSGQGSPGETGGWPSGPSGSPGGDYEQQTGDYCRQHCGKDDFDPEKLAALLRKWFEAAIYPPLQAAEKDDSTVDAAGGAFLNWARQVSLISLDEYLAKELKKGMDSFLKGLANAFDQSYQRCMQVNAYEASKMLQRLKEIGMLNGMYGGTAPQGYTLEDKKPELKSCLTFKLQVDSLVTFKPEDSKVEFTTQVAGEVTLKLNTDTWKFDGSGTLQTKSYTFEGMEEDLGGDEHCTADYGSMQSTTLDIKDATISWEGQDAQSATAKVSIVLKPGGLFNGSVKIKCWHYMSDGVTKVESKGELPSVPMWNGAFVVAHEDRKQGDGFLFTEFQTGSGQLFARLTDSASKSKMGITASDDLTLDLLHTPGQ